MTRKNILALSFRDAYLAKTFASIKSDSVQVEYRPIRETKCTA